MIEIPPNIRIHPSYSFRDGVGLDDYRTQPEVNEEKTIFLVFFFLKLAYERNTLRKRAAIVCFCFRHIYYNK